MNPDFIFAFPAYNVRSTEINAVLGRSQLKRLDANNENRTRNLNCFLDHLDPKKFFTDFEREGSCNYAFTLVLREPDQALWDRHRERRCASGRSNSGAARPAAATSSASRSCASCCGDEFEKYPAVNHVHFFGAYIGNYPDLETDRIQALCELLNSI